MKAYWIRPQGDRPVVELRETPSPEPKAGQVLVRVHAASLNRGELIVRHGIHATPGKTAAEAKPGGPSAPARSSASVRASRTSSPATA